MFYNVQKFSGVSIEYRCPMVPLGVCDSVYKLTNILDF